VISRFTVPIDKPTKVQIQKDGMASEAAMSIKRQRLDTSAEKRFYKWEDSVLWPASTVSFSYLTTFREVDDEGNKISIQGNRGESETHYKLIYLIDFKTYQQKIMSLSKMVAAAQ